MSVDRALQVSITPADLAHARCVLPHQIRTWQDQVDRILITVDTCPSWGRYGQGWEEQACGLDELLAEVSADPLVEVIPVDHSTAVANELSRLFLGGTLVPVKDSHGGPFYAYLFGLHYARARFVLHTDSDMLYGGGSTTWFDTAVAMLASDDDVLFSGPFPGPPSPDGTLNAEALLTAAVAQAHGSVAEPLTTLGYPALQFRHMSTRSFLIDIERFYRRIPAIELESTPAARLRLRSPGVAPMEVCLSAALRRYGMKRIDIVGPAPGMWGLHPTFRSPRFFEKLPSIIHRVECGDLPNAQRGAFDLDSSMIDPPAVRDLPRRGTFTSRLRRAVTPTARPPRKRH